MTYFQSEMTEKRTKSKRKRSWPHVYSRKHRSGQASYVVDLGLINGKRERHSFKTKAEASTFAELKKTERQNQGTAALALPQAVKVDAAKASEILTPHSVSLQEAARYYVRHVIAYRNAPLINKIVKQMLADAEKNDRRDRTVSELKSRLNSFAEGFPNQRMSDLTVEEIKAWIDEDEDWSARTRINYLTKISQLFNYALKHNWVDTNLVERIDRPSADDTEPKIFTIEEAESLLKHANKFGLLPYVALGLFAGLRSAELMRLDGKDVKFEDRAVIVGQQVAKKRSRRVVEMCDALHAWLEPLKPLNGPIVDVKEFRDNMDELRKAAELKAWPHNGLRHSFGSYHLSFHGDAVKTAGQMGHRSSDVIHNHYKALVMKTESEKFWNLTPPTVVVQQ
ncbi:MAG: tyrosine-type recombinase/integrase [Deltaproteobacteria bacterium]